MGEGVAFVGIGRAPQRRAPVFDMVARARVHLHIIPIEGVVVLQHRLRQSLGAPLLDVAVPPEADRHVINLGPSQRGIHALPLVHDISSPFRAVRPTSPAAPLSPPSRPTPIPYRKDAPR